MAGVYEEIIFLRLLMCVFIFRILMIIKPEQFSVKTFKSTCIFQIADMKYIYLVAVFYMCLSPASHGPQPGEIKILITYLTLC